MMHAVRHLTQQVLEDAIRDIPTDAFDSHELIRHLYARFQHEYLAELNENSSAQYPFTETHRQIGLALSRMMNVVVRDGRESSPNIRGESTPNQRWRRL